MKENWSVIVSSQIVTYSPPRCRATCWVLESKVSHLIILWHTPTEKTPLCPPKPSDAPGFSLSKWCWLYRLPWVLFVCYFVSLFCLFLSHFLIWKETETTRKLNNPTGKQQEEHLWNLRLSFFHQEFGEIMIIHTTTSDCVMGFERKLNKSKPTYDKKKALSMTTFGKLASMSITDSRDTVKEAPVRW